MKIADRPKAPYLLIDSRRLDAGNSFVPVKENSELTLACISEGGNPKPILSWEVLISPGVDRHSQKVSADVLELQEIKNEVTIFLSITLLNHHSLTYLILSFKLTVPDLKNSIKRLNI